MDFDGRDLIFLIGLPRSGTTLLQSLLGQHKDIFTYSESWVLLPPLFWLKEGKLIAPAYGSSSSTWALEDLLAKSRHGSATYVEAVRRMVSTLYGSCLEASGKRIFLDKSPPYYLIMKEIADIFPRAKMVVLLRNPLAVLSSIARTWFKGKCGPILLCPVHTHSISVGPYAIAAGLKSLSNQCLTLKYEDLVADPTREIKKICEYVDLDFDDKMLSYETRPGGRLGDMEAAKHSRPSTSSLMDWVRLFDDYANYKFAISYIDFLGPELFRALGYDYGETRSAVERSWRDKSDLFRLKARTVHLLEAANSTMHRSFFATRDAFQIEWNSTWHTYFPRFPPLIPDFRHIEGLNALQEKSTIQRLKPVTTIASYWQQLMNYSPSTE